MALRSSPVTALEQDLPPATKQRALDILEVALEVINPSQASSRCSNCTARPWSRLVVTAAGEQQSTQIALLNSDACHFPEALADLMITGPTNTNVNDLILVFAFWRHTRLDGRPPSMDHT